MCILSATFGCSLLSLHIVSPVKSVLGPMDTDRHVFKTHYLRLLKMQVMLTSHQSEQLQAEFIRFLHLSTSHCQGIYIAVSQVPMSCLFPLTCFCFPVLFSLKKRFALFCYLSSLEPWILRFFPSSSSKFMKVFSSTKVISSLKEIYQLLRFKFFFSKCNNYKML